MKTQRSILIAFILNLSFALFEFVGGLLTGSVAIASDAVHDIGDAASIGISCLLERKSRRQPDEKHTYGYLRYSVIGGLITTLILLTGSAVMIYNSVRRLIAPVEINYKGMIGFAVVGVLVNFFAAFFTREGGSLNQRAVNLHLLEDVLGWIVVLVGAVVMHFTGLWFIDPLMSIGVSVFIVVGSLKNLKEIADLFLEKVPRDIDLAELKEHIGKIDGVTDVHHVHLRSMDGFNHYATMHVVCEGDTHEIKENIRRELGEHGIGHVTIETEAIAEHCHHRECHVETKTAMARCCHGHHHIERNGEVNCCLQG